MPEQAVTLPTKPAKWQDLRLIWGQLHGSHQSWNPEGVLHDSGFRFLAGKHQLDDPLCYAAMGDPSAFWPGGKRPERFVLKSTTRYEPPEPPPGGYEHLSWCYFNKEPSQLVAGVLDGLHRMDPEACLLLFVREGHPEFRRVVERIQGGRPSDWLAMTDQADAEWEAYRKRVAVFFHKVGWRAWEGDDAATVDDEKQLWALAEHVIVTPHAVTERPAEWSAHQAQIEAGSHERLDGHFTVEMIQAVADRARQLIFTRL